MEDGDSADILSGSIGQHVENKPKLGAGDHLEAIVIIRVYHPSLSGGSRRHGGG